MLFSFNHRRRQHLLSAAGLVILLVLGSARAEAPSGETVAADDDPRTAANANNPTGFDRVSFRNGDRLSGQLLEMKPGSVLRWQHPEVGDPIEFNPEQIMEIKLGSSLSQLPVSGDLAVTLTNDDELIGNVVAMDGERLQVDTWYGERIAIPRVMVRRLVPRGSSGNVLYAGPNHDGDWQHEAARPGAWSFEDEALYASGPGSIGRRFELPDLLEFSFDLAWQTLPQLQVGLYTDRSDQLSGLYYLLQITSHNIDLRRGDQHGLTNLGGINLGATPFQHRQHARFTICVDRPKKLIALLIDNQVVKQWIDNRQFVGSGDGIVFRNLSPAALGIRNIQLREWRGELSLAETLSADQQDAIVLINGDQAEGKLVSIQNGIVAFASPSVGFDVPLSRVARMELAADNQERARRRGGDVLAILHDGGRLTFQMDHIDRAMIHGSSDNCGKVVLDRRAIAELQFHIYDDGQTTRTATEWDFETTLGRKSGAEPELIRLP